MKTKIVSYMIVTPFLLGVIASIALTFMAMLAFGALFSMILIANAYVFIANYMNDGITIFTVLFLASVLGLMLIKQFNRAYTSNDHQRHPEG